MFEWLSIQHLVVRAKTAWPGVKIICSGGATRLPHAVCCFSELALVMKTFVTDISAFTGRNDFIFDIWLCKFGMVTWTVSPLSRLTAHLLPVYRARIFHVFTAFSGNEC
jgi:hypothetical protein